jgi:hypothetical protein
MLLSSNFTLLIGLIPDEPFLQPMLLIYGQAKGWD